MGNKTGEKRLIEEMKDISTVLWIGMLIILGIFYINFVTYKGKLEGIQTLYVKIDGKNGAVLKINNKYTGKQITIKNSKNMSYGFYLIKFRIKNSREKNGFIILEGKILGYKESGLNGVRRYILNIFDELFMTEDNLYAFSKAAILGEKSDISKDMNDKFKYTGLAHLVVISGSHISLVIIGIVKMLDRIYVGYRIKYILSLVILTFYCTITGMSAGILRAYIMGAIMILARIMFEREDSKKSLVISMIIILILNPYSLFDISLQLSYAAVIAIIFIYPIFEKIFEEKYFFRMKDGIKKDIIKLIILSLVIQITSIPLFLYYFDKLPLFSFLLNIVGVPIGTVLIEFLFGITLLNILCIKMINPVLILSIKIVYGAFEGFIYSGSKLPLLQIEIPFKINIVTVFTYYGMLILVCLKLKKYLNSLKSNNLK